MIIYALLAVFFGLSNGIVALFPKGDAPAFIGQVSPLLHQAVASGNGLSPWIPWATAASVAGVVFTVWLSLTVISGIRWLVGWIPTMGGA